MSPDITKELEDRMRESQKEDPSYQAVQQLFETTKEWFSAVFVIKSEVRKKTWEELTV